MTTTDAEIDAWIDALDVGAPVRIRTGIEFSTGLSRFGGSQARVTKLVTIGLMVTIPGEPGEWFATIDDIEPA